jgi:hypothetical protein
MQLLEALVKSAHYRNSVVVATVLCLVIGACKERADGGQRARPDALIVVPGATNLQDTDENEGTVAYEVKEEYPAQPIIETIRRRLESKGWRPLQESFLNPGLPNSFTSGWASHADSTGERPIRVYEWVGQWEDDSKRIAWYVLNYDAVTAAGGEIRAQGRLKVRATLVSAESAKALRDAAQISRSEVSAEFTSVLS